VILVDSNVPMYPVGAAHTHTADAQRLLEWCIADRGRLVTDAEVLQELLHRYVAIDRRDAIQPAFDALLAIVDDVFPLEAAEGERAESIVLGSARLSARDALHIAIMDRHTIARILSFNAGFDGFPGVGRLNS
jgi:hypothetical protein